MNYKVTYKRHLAKTISYRAISTLVGFLIMWWATGSVKFGAAFGVAELLYKPIQYYIHERIWYKYIRFGLVKEKKSSKPTEPSPVKKQQVEPEVKRKVLNYSSSR